jgi:hypothetical protein
MRKTYLPESTDTSAANNLRRVLNAHPLEAHLDRSPRHFDCLQLPEPELLFAENQRCIDPRTGVTAFGPIWRNRGAKRPQMLVAIVGTDEGIEKTLKQLEEICNPMEQDPNIDCILHPSFPGLNSGLPFEVDLVAKPGWRRLLSPQDLRDAEQCDGAVARVECLQQCFSREVSALSALESPPHVVICAVSESMERLLNADTPANGFNPAAPEDFSGNDAESKSQRIMRRFTSGLKAACVNFLPTEIFWHTAQSGIGGAKDRATPAWNFSAALFYKAGLVPWRLADPEEDACYIGISSRSSTNSTSPDSRAIFAQVFTEIGKGFVIEAETNEANPGTQTNRTPDLTKDQTAKLASRVLEVYKAERGRLPRKVVIHKTSRYTDAERSGFENAFGKMSGYALVTVTRRGIFFVRPGRKPVLRGTAIPFGEKLGLVYASGYVPFLRNYAGSRLPQPLEITENWGSMTFQEAAADLLRLTKLNSDTTAFCTEDPITLAYSNRVAEILYILSKKSMSTGERRGLHREQPGKRVDLRWIL